MLLILLYSCVNVGDVSHAEALYAKLMAQAPTAIRLNIDANLAPIAIQDAYKQALATTNHQKALVLAVGEKGLQALGTLRINKLLKPDVFVAASVHQYFPLIELLPLNFLAVPRAGLSAETQNYIQTTIANYAFTMAVPTKNSSLADLEQAYLSWNLAAKPGLDRSYIVVMLPGDAPDSSGKIRHFTKESARQLFRCISLLREQYANHHEIIVQNGPRTGKFARDGETIQCSHKYAAGEDPGKAIDDVSNYFVALLRENNIPHYFFNFAFRPDGTSNSVNLQLLYLAQLPGRNNFRIIPGESVSELAQIPLYMPPNRAIVFKPDSINAQHEAIFQELFNRGHLSCFAAATCEVVQPAVPVQMENDDSITVANEIIKGFVRFKKTMLLRQSLYS